jgi:hypothetical protein
MEKIKIDTETYQIPSNSFYKTKHKKNQIILAGSLRKENYHIKRFQKKNYGKTKKWCTYSISRSGTIYQHYDPKCYTDFMGIKDIDKHSISIVLENMGMVYFDVDSNMYLNWILEECDNDKVLELNWKSCRYWEKYTPEQFASTVDLCKSLCDTHKITLDSLGFNVYDPTTPKFKGIVTRSNFDSSYSDLNPSFDFKTFLNRLGIEYGI